MKQADTITIAKLTEMAAKMYGTFVKGVVDVRQEIIALDAELHVDLEQFLLEKGSAQDDLWGFNLYPGKFGTEEFIEFDSMINIRPKQHNMSRGVESEAMRGAISAIILRKVKS